MKRNLPMAALLLLMTLGANSQITINTSDFPSIGYLYIHALDNTTTINPGNAGTNQTWDFSNLIASTYDSVYYLSSQGLPGAANYPQANMAEDHNPNSSSYNYNYCETTNLGWKWYADETYMPIFGTFTMGLHVKYEPAPLQLKCPFTFGSSSSESFKATFTIASRNAGVLVDSSMTISHETVTMNGDASGTMILPDGSFPVLRVKEQITSVDSNFTWNGSSWTFNDTSMVNWYSYRWYTNNYGEIGYWSEDNKKAPSFNFFKSSVLVGIKDKNHVDFTISPNPVTDMINISTSGQLKQCQIIDMNGNRVKNSSESKISVSDLAKGIYVIRINTTRGTGVGKFTKE